MSPTLKSHRVLVGLFGPLLALVALRWWLTFQLETSGQTLPPALSSAGDPEQLMVWVALVSVLAALMGVLVWWLMRKPADPLAAARHAVHRNRVLQGLFWCWVAVGVWGLTQTWRAHANRLGLQPTRTVSLKVVAVQVQPASTRSLGGAKVFLDWPDNGGLHTVLLEPVTEPLLRKPDMLQLQLAPGRWNGWFVLGWTVPGVDLVLPAAPTGAQPERAAP